MRCAAVVLLAACGRIGFDPLAPPLAVQESTIASGDRFTCVIRPDASVVCWGAGRRGQLGNGELAVKTSVVPTLVSNAKRIDAGFHHACALLRDGRLVCWGDNVYAQLAKASSSTPEPAPLEVTGLPEAIDKLALGSHHTCVILADRSLWCWGRNGDGELGIAPSGAVATPRQVLDDVLEASGGESFTCALRGDHSVWCWGKNSYGNLGDGSMTDRFTPQPIPNLTADHISVGDKHACAILAGRFTCWGLNNNGELGDATTTDRAMPGPLSERTDIAHLDAGNDHNCAALASGDAVCWGLNSDGSVGNGKSTRFETSPTLVMLGGRVARVSTGGLHSCAQRDDGSVACWGYGSMGQLANGMLSEWSPLQVPLPDQASWLTVGDHHACAVVGPGGEVWCWGDNLSGQLGHGGGEFAIATPVRAGTLTGVTRVSAGGAFTCASDAGGSQCWGANGNGQLGDGTRMMRANPSPSSFGATTSMAGGNQFMCAVTTATTVLCAGKDTSGQLGDGGGPDRPVPLQVAVANPVGVAAGYAHACVRLGNSTVSCWGDNTQSQVGVGRTTAIEPVSPLTGTFTEVHAGGEHTCAIRSTGELACWGDNEFGELGDGTKSDRDTPTTIAVPGTGAVGKFGLGDYHTCAVRSGNLYCWGSNIHGELGDGTGIDRLTPQLVAPMDLTGIGGGLGFTCVLFNTSGVVTCWGDNNRGQIGQGNMTRSLVPVEINFP